MCPYEKNLETYLTILVHIEYMICKHIMLIKFWNETELIFWYNIKWLQMFLCYTNNSIYD